MDFSNFVGKHFDLFLLFSDDGSAGKDFLVEILLFLLKGSESVFEGFDLFFVESGILIVLFFDLHKGFEMAVFEIFVFRFKLFS